MSSTDSHHSETLAADPAGSPENEALPVGMIALVAIVSTVCFALGILWAIQIQRGVEDDNERMGGPWVKGEYVGKAEVGIVDLNLFELETRAHDLNVQKLQKLDQYGWVSRKDELIQIPISEAMKAVVAGKRPPKTVQQPPPAPQDGATGATGATGAPQNGQPTAPTPATPAEPGRAPTQPAPSGTK